MTTPSLDQPVSALLTSLFGTASSLGARMAQAEEDNAALTGAVAQLTSDKGALQSQVLTLEQQVASSSGATGLAGTFTLNLDMAAGDVLFAPATPDGQAGWTLTLNGTQPPQIGLSGLTVIRGTGDLTQGATYILPLRWSKAGQTDKVFTLTFMAAATTPPKSLFDVTAAPLLMVNSLDPANPRKDIYILSTDAELVVPIAWINRGDGAPYPFSRTLGKVVPTNLTPAEYNTSSGGGVQVEPFDHQFFPYHATRKSIRLAMNNTYADTGRFRLDLTYLIDGPQMPEGTGLGVIVHVINNLSEVPLGYELVQYETCSTPVPEFNPPSTTPSFDSDFLEPTMDIRPVGENYSADYYSSHVFDLNPEDTPTWTFVQPDVTQTANGVTITQAMVLPIRQIDGVARRCMVIHDCGAGDGVMSKGVIRRFVGAALQRNIFPQYGFIDFEVQCTAMAGVDGGPTLWRYGGGEKYEDDFLEVIVSTDYADRCGAQTYHDRNDVPCMSTSPIARPVTDHMRRRFYIGKKKRYNWLSDADGGNERLIAETPNPFEGLIWNALNILNEGPGSTAAGAFDSTLDYTKYQAVLFRLTIHQTAGEDEVVYPDPFWTVNPSVSGKHLPWEQLACAPGTMSYGYASKYQLRRDGVVQDAAVSRLYNVAEADVGHTIGFRVTMTGLDGAIVTYDTPDVAIQPLGAVVATAGFGRADATLSAAGWGQTDTGGLTWFPISASTTAGISGNEGILSGGAYPQQGLDVGTTYAEIEFTADVTTDPVLMSVGAFHDSSGGVIFGGDGGIWARSANLANDGIQAVVGGAFPQLGGRHRFRCVVNTDKVARIYADGQLINQVALPAGLVLGTCLGIGNYTGSATAGATRFDDVIVRQAL